MFSRILAIAGRTFVGKTTVTSVLDALERRALVRRSPHPTNRRSVLVAATPAGSQACGVSCPAPAACTAAGTSAGLSNVGVTLVMSTGA